MIAIVFLIMVLLVMGIGPRTSPDRAAQPNITWERCRRRPPATKRQIKRAYRRQRADLRQALKR